MSVIFSAPAYTLGDCDVIPSTMLLPPCWR